MTEVMDKVQTLQQFIGGRWVDRASGETLAVENPANGKVIANVPASDPEDVDRAVEAAATAFETWQKTTPAERTTALLKIADALEARRRGARPRSRAPNAGKPLDVAAIDEMPVDRRQPAASSPARPAILEGKAASEYIAGHTSMIRREPVGVVASIAPWNYPLMMAAWKIGPALAAGNTVVLKPSARTPLTALKLAEIAADILPPGVLNVVAGTGDAIGDALVAHPKVGMVSITGDTDDRQADRQGRRRHASSGSTSSSAARRRSSSSTTPTSTLAAETLQLRGYYNAGQDCTAATAG